MSHTQEMLEQEVAKIGKLLLAVEAGVKKYAGKKLADTCRSSKSKQRLLHRIHRPLVQV